ncbi:MAG: hypothetical protein VX715_09135 [Planctomycetota bacterium]|nr:hypothetical protein [Planctomycetota bacterium]
MKKLLAVLLVAFVAVAIAPKDVDAVPAFKKAFDQRVTNVSKDAKLVTAIKAAKCNVCHYVDGDKKSKKQKNDFGVAMGKLLKKDNYKSTRIAAEPDKVKAEFDAAFEKLMATKNAKGKTYGELLESGNLPGTVNLPPKK